MKLMVFLISMLLLVHGVLAATYKQCLDENTLQTRIDMVINNDQLQISENRTCQYGCNSVFSECNSPPAQKEAVGFPLPFYIFFEVVALLTFFITFTNVLQLGKEPRIFLSMFATILFAGLSFLSFKIQLAENYVVYILPMVIFNLFFTIISVLNSIGIYLARLGEASG